jgi:hypothetical protein
MPLPRAVPVTLTVAERTTLKKRARGPKAAHRDRPRAQIVLAAARGRRGHRPARCEEARRRCAHYVFVSLGQQRQSVDVEADYLSHDLRRGVSGFQKTLSQPARTAAGEPGAGAVPADDAVLAAPAGGTDGADDMFDDSAIDALAKEADSATAPFSMDQMRVTLAVAFGAGDVPAVRAGRRVQPARRAAGPAPGRSGLAGSPAAADTPVTAIACLTAVL